MRRQVAFVCLIAMLMAAAVAGDPVAGRPGKPGAPTFVTLAGAVIGLDGQPSPSARVWCIGCGMAKTPVKPSGAFELKAPEIGGVGPILYGIAAVDEAQGLCGFTAVDPAHSPVTIRLQPAASLTMTVVDALDKPLSKIDVDVIVNVGERSCDVIETAASDEAGQIHFGCLPAGVPLRAQIDYDLQYLVLSPEWDHGIQCKLVAGEDRKLPTLKLNPDGRSLKVFVGDVGGKPVPRAEVYAGGCRQHITVDDQGKGELRGLRARGKVIVVAAHPSLALFAAATIDPDAQYWPGLLLHPLGSATGVLTDRIGKPIAGAAITCLPDSAIAWSDPRLRERIGYTGDTGWGKSITGADGRWTAANVVPGLDYSLMLWAHWGGGDYVGMGRVGDFTAAGGPQLQDVGTMDCPRPPRM